MRAVHIAKRHQLRIVLEYYVLKLHQGLIEVMGHFFAGFIPHSQIPGW